MLTIDTYKETQVGVFELKVQGEIDASSSIQLETALKNAMNESHKILVNMSELEYISSAGLGVFMSIIQDLENNGIQMVLFNLNERVLEVFEILGLDQLMNISSSKDQALVQIK